MSIKFPSPEWLQIMEEKLNSDPRYAQAAKKWEGDMCIVMEPDGPLTEELFYYWDLWHGKCRKVDILKNLTEIKPAFLLKASYGNIAKIMKGELDPIQALMTRKLQVQGSMAYMMRNVPTILEFVRCAREITSDVL